MTLRSLLLFAGIIFSANVYCTQENSAHQQPTHDGRMGSKCNGTVVPNAVCDVSFLQLIANPERYDGQIIAVVGYLALDDRVLTLFPTENSYRAYDLPSSLEFFIPSNQQIELAHKYAYSYVRFVGQFNGKSEGTNSRRLGVFTKSFGAQPISIRDAIGKEKDPVVRLEDIKGN